jgi:hypothetical protein
MQEPADHFELAGALLFDPAARAPVTVAPEVLHRDPMVWYIVARASASARFAGRVQ